MRVWCFVNPKYDKSSEIEKIWVLFCGWTKMPVTVESCHQTKPWHCFLTLIDWLINIIFLQGLWLRNRVLRRVHGEHWARISCILWQVIAIIRWKALKSQMLMCSFCSVVAQQTRILDLSCKGPAKTWLEFQLRDWWVKCQHAGLLQEPLLLLLVPVRRRWLRRRRRWWAPTKRWWWRRRRRRRRRKSFHLPWTLWTLPRDLTDWSPF